MPVLDNLKIIFIHIPKTGGSSINEFFKLEQIREKYSIEGRFLSELQLPGYVWNSPGDDFVRTSEDLRDKVSRGDFIRIGTYLYQVHADKPVQANRIHLSCLDHAYNTMHGHLAHESTPCLNEVGKKHAIYKKLVSDAGGNKIIPSRYHWGWITTQSQNGRALKQVFEGNKIIKTGHPAIELDHVSIHYIQKHVSPEQFNTYYSFCFVRNPYDRVVSEYFWKRKDKDMRFGIDSTRMTFRQFVYALAKQFPVIWNQPHWEVSHFLPQYLFVYDTNDQLKVNKVYKFEDSLENGLGDVFETLGFGTRDEIKLNKSNSTRHSRQHYTHYLTQDLREIIYNLYRKDFELFGYDK